MLTRLRLVSRCTLITIIAGAAATAAEQPSLRASATLRMRVPELDRCRQLLAVAAPDWDSVSAPMRCFERRDGHSAWMEVMKVPKVSLGRSGLAWGIGLHGMSDGVGPPKREGDGKAPAGIFPLIDAFGFASGADTKLPRFPYRQLTDAMEGIDDPASKHYNRLVDARMVGPKDWKSSELMRRVEPYRWGAVVGHNWKQVPGAGSCIFLHVWEAPDVPTAGCTAMPEEQMLQVLRWLDRKKNPMLVQLPEGEYARLRSAWKLP